MGLWAWLMLPHDKYQRHLEEEVEFWRMLYERERQRAEQSIDARLAEGGRHPVTFPLRRDPTRRQQAADPVEKLLTNPEFYTAGMTPDDLAGEGLNG